MKKKLQIISGVTWCCVITILFFVACSESGSTGETKQQDSLIKRTLPNANSRESVLKKVNYLDSLMLNSTSSVPDKNIAQQFISACGEFVMFFPQDSLSPKFSFQSCAVAVNVYADQQALILIDNCLKNFPSHPNKIELLLMKAMVYDDRLHDKDRARLVYEQIVKEFPGTPAADQAKAAMRYSDKSDLEMIREMEKKNGIR